MIIVLGMVILNFDTGGKYTEKFEKESKKKQERRRIGSVCPRSQRNRFKNKMINVSNIVERTVM